MRIVLMLAFTMLMFGSYTQIAAGRTPQKAEERRKTQKRVRSCHPEPTYKCPQPVVSRPYYCTPMLTKECTVIDRKN
jgi:hypothetical protein